MITPSHDATAYLLKPNIDQKTTKEKHTNYAYTGRGSSVERVTNQCNISSIKKRACSEKA